MGMADVIPGVARGAALLFSLAATNVNSSRRIQTHVCLVIMGEDTPFMTQFIPV